MYLKQPLRPGQGFTPELNRLVEQPAPKRKKSRKRRPLPMPARSARLYVCIDPSMVHMFRFFLETEDNLGIMTVVDRWRAVLLIRYSPHQERRMREFLDGVGLSLSISVMEAPGRWKS